MKTLQLWPVVELPQGPGELVVFDPGPQRTLYTLHALEALDYRDESGAFPKIHPSTPQRYRAQAWLDGEPVLDLTIEGERYNIHHLQPLGDDLLLVCSRSSARGGDSHLNGRVYSRSGRLMREMALGDAVEHVQTTAHGQIWTGYFDEGLASNNPITASGLVAWDAQGTPVYRYDPAPPLDRIIDCYALNLASHNEVWLCYYTTFPLVQLRDRRIVRSWTVPTPARYSNAFAVFRDHALFAGGDDRDSYHLLGLGEGPQASLIETFALIDETGTPLRAERIAGRGDTLYLLSAARVYAFDIHQAIGVLAR